LAAALAVCCVITLPDAPKLIAFENAGPGPVINSNNNVSFGAGAAPQLPQTPVIPAAERTAEVPSRAAVPRKSFAAGIRPTNFSEARGTRQTQIEVRPVKTRPVMVRASAQEEVAPRVQLVMQMTQYDERGSAIFNLCVWRVTFESGNQQEVRQEVIVKSL
jgi:hypothetical protein